jgi:hypothetical protein
MVGLVPAIHARAVSMSCPPLFPTVAAYEELSILAAGSGA